MLGYQKLNMARAVSAGYAVQLDYDNVTEESLNWALREVLDNSRYFL
jgi:UDP:flavonoid glycosyltransferase YjiC (YdhE family)